MVKEVEQAPEGQEQEQQQEPVSTRDTIRAAIQEQKDKIAQEEVVKAKTEVLEPKEPKEPSEPKVERTPPVKAEAKDAKEQVEKPATEVKAEKPEAGKEPEKKVKVPFGIKKEIREKWDTYDETTRQEIARLTKENLDIKSNEGRRTHLRDVDTVLTPYMPEMQRLGVSPAQLVKRLLEYGDALASPQQKYFAIAKLAHDFGVDLTVFGKQQQQTDQDPNNSQQQQQQQVEYVVPPEVENELLSLREKVTQVEGSQRTASDKYASDFLNTWAGFDPNTSEYTKKPYFPYVRQAMSQLLVSGAVPISNGRVDLDTAYEVACYANPEIRERMVDDQNRSIAAAAEQQKQKQIEAAKKAKFAGSSIRSGAPVVATQKVPANKTNSGKPLSVRDSIVLAMNEARNA
jgi:hypothetical protein